MEPRAQSELHALDLRHHVGDFVEVSFGVKDNLNGIFLLEAARGHLLADAKLKRVSDRKNTLVLWPQVAFIVTSTSTKWDQMIDFKVLAVHTANTVTKHFIVFFDDVFLGVGGYISFTVEDPLGVSLRVARLAEATFCNHVFWHNGKCFSSDLMISCGVWSKAQTHKAC